MKHSNVWKRILLWCIIVLPVCGLTTMIMYMIGINDGTIPNTPENVQTYKNMLPYLLLCTMGTFTSFFIVVFTDSIYSFFPDKKEVKKNSGFI